MNTITIAWIGLSSGVTMLVIAYLFRRKGLKGLIKEALLTDSRFRALSGEEQRKLVDSVDNVVATKLKEN